MTKKTEKSLPIGPIPALLGPSTSTLGTLLGSVPLSTSFVPSSSHGPQMFLRIRVADTADAAPAHISSTIPVYVLLYGIEHGLTLFYQCFSSAGMYMQEALELVCKKRKLNPSEYALLVKDPSILIPLDRTVASLSGNKELLLVKRSMIPEIAPNLVKVAGKTTDPNGK
jgi:target of rapamycin complex 2 subunit MAPKAP1